MMIGTFNLLFNTCLYCGAGELIAEHVSNLTITNLMYLKTYRMILILTCHVQRVIP